ncbi:MAG: hypothetical protein MSD07_09650 [Bacteroidales bacterium]|nr:hypothetical protein [Bacteroidales bacterium]MDD6851964.1 hypothetical protein [Bacteroidales bacterium]
MVEDSLYKFVCPSINAYPETLIDAIGEHKSGCEGNPSIYCGTYGKYNGEKGMAL